MVVVVICLYLLCLYCFNITNQPPVKDRLVSLSIFGVRFSLAAAYWNNLCLVRVTDFYFDVDWHNSLLLFVLFFGVSKLPHFDYADCKTSSVPDTVFLWNNQLSLIASRCLLRKINAWSICLQAMRNRYSRPPLLSKRGKSGNSSSINEFAAIDFNA